MGPFNLADTVGIDVGYKVASILHEEYGYRMPVAPLIEKMYEAKYFGKKVKQVVFINMMEKMIM